MAIGFSKWYAAPLVICLLIFDPSFARAQNDKDENPSEVYQAQFYLGLAGDYSKVKDTASSRLSAFLGRYFASTSKLNFGIQSDLSWFNQQDLYNLGAELGLLVEWRFNKQAARPFLLIGGGVNAESIGAFNISRYPLGLGTGIRFPILDRGFFQLDYKYRYIFNDPVEDFPLHQLSVGAALLLN